MKPIVLICLIVIALVAITVLDQDNKSAASSVVPIATPVAVQKTELDAEKLWNIIQEWREFEKLNKYTKSDKLCDIADVRVVQISDNFSHKDFPSVVNKFCGSRCNIIYSENIIRSQDEHDSLNWWLNSASHSAALHKNYPYSCIATFGEYGVQIFSY